MPRQSVAPRRVSTRLDSPRLDASPLSDSPSPLHRGGESRERIASPGCTSLSVVAITIAISHHRRINRSHVICAHTLGVALTPPNALSLPGQPTQPAGSSQGHCAHRRNPPTSVAIMSISPRHRAISPPTPAPSPQPDLHTSIRLANNAAAAAAAAAAGSAASSAAGLVAPHPFVVDPHDPSQLLKHLSLVLPQYSQSARFRLISELTDLFSLRELAHLSSVIHPRLKVDFLSALPIEVSLNILSFIDDPKTLARASCVSRFWRSLVNDEHTWKVMCLKHKYRRRGSSNAAAAAATAAASHSLDDRLIRSVAATPSHLALSTPRLAASASLGALLEQPHRPDPSSDMPDDEADELPSHHDDDAAVLSSLYQRYRDRGLDPSNALHELRTLHDLFLSKQDSAHGSLDDSMSDADLAFYAQLEEIVEEESRARYGDDAVPTDHHPRILDSRAAPAIAPTAARSNAFDILATPIAEASAPSTSAHLGWLSARPPTATTAPSQPLRTLAPTQPSPSLSATTSHAVSSSIRTASGQLDRLQGWQQPSPSLFTTPNQTRDADAPTSNSLSQSGPADNDSDEAMDMDDQLDQAQSAHDDATAAANIGQPPNAPLLASLPHHDSPTGRFSASASSPRPGPAASSLVPGPRDARRSNLLRPGASASTDAASSPSTQRPRSLRGVSDARSSRRGSEAAEAETTGLGLGTTASSSSRSPVRERSAVAGPSRLSLASTSAVHAHRHRSAKVPFSYRTHFKMAYLTESNWRKGGRLQTQHVSADAGHVVTSLAIDSEWIVVGMANSKIHVFSAETGLYAHTLLGHDAGVWCLTLISRTGKGSKRAAADASLSSDLGKGKMVITDPEDGSGGKPYQAAADGDLRLVHHDPRPDAADALLSPPTSSIELPDEPDVSGSRRPPSSTASTPASGKARQTYGHGETLEWFHKARRALRRQQSARRAAALTAAGGAGDSPAAASAQHNMQLDGYASGAGDSDADISIRSEGPSFVHRELRSSARARVERENAKAVAEAEAGAIRDAVMADGTGNIPAELAEEIRRNGESASGPDPAGPAGESTKAAGSVHSTSTSTAQLAGNALGMGNPCGSVLGYGNQDAIVVSATATTRWWCSASAATRRAWMSSPSARPPTRCEAAAPQVFGLFSLVSAVSSRDVFCICIVVALHVSSAFVPPRKSFLFSTLSFLVLREMAMAWACTGSVMQRGTERKGASEK
ncbi:hypothetical protein L1887_46121 [Cichorium endivia]|nr:hypothetical protein L1887_46121 [Cichorium endivia]